MSEIIVINNYVDFPDESKICKHTSTDIIMFLGKMDYEPNITAVSHFVKNVFPELKNNHPHLKFIIVGAKPTKGIQELSQFDGIDVTGFVESTEPYFQDATIVIAPMLSGAGVQNKIIQAMSYGCCVATTDIGAEGLTLQGNDLEILNTDKEWISGLTDLLSDKEKRKKIGMNARQTIQNTLSKEIVFQQFQKLFSNI